MGNRRFWELPFGKKKSEPKREKDESVADAIQEVVKFQKDMAAYKKNQQQQGVGYLQPGNQISGVTFYTGATTLYRSNHGGPNGHATTV